MNLRKRHEFFNQVELREHVDLYKLSLVNNKNQPDCAANNSEQTKSAAMHIKKRANDKPIVIQDEPFLKPKVSLKAYLDLRREQTFSQES